MSYALELLNDLIAIPSQIGIENEKNVAQFLENLLKSKGFDIEKYEFVNGRPNIIASYTFNNHGLTILFNGHMDTMPADNGEKINVWKTNPFKPEIIDGKLYGRGACDMKGGIAGALAAIFKFIEENRSAGSIGKIIVNLVCDEENTSLYGTIPLCERNLLAADIAIVMEPTENKVCKKQLGNMFFESHILGDGGHTGLPEGKINPYEIAEDYLKVLKEWIITKRINKNDSQPFINIGRYEGGTSSGTIPTECVLYWGTRVMPYDNFNDYQKEVDIITEKFNSSLDKRCKITTKLFESGGIDSFYSESKWLDKLVKVSEKEESTFCASSDAGFLKNVAGIEACVFGPGSLKQAHLPNEYIEIKELEEYVDVVYKYLKSF
ncbi:MAG: ArgE/DapE family deacylase [Clostridia bacterium]|nr:ArgE/DapE family deacylase [Clostridia bacterium]